METKINFNIAEAENEGWVQTDYDTEQYYKEIVKDKIYHFREEREIDPVTFETEEYDSVMNIDNYTRDQISAACVDTFGYTEEEVNEFLVSDVALVLECLFELEN